MKTKLLQEIYSQVDENTKRELEKEYPQLIEKPFNAWYVSTEDPEYLTFNKKIGWYGLDSIGEWVYDTYRKNTIHPHEILAIKEQILERLIPQAKRRGLVNIGNISIKIPFLDNQIREKGFYETADNEYELFKYNTELRLDSVTILKDGVWAEVIEDENPTNQKELITDLKKLIEEYENNVEL